MENHQALARKYRPQNFTQIIGQDIVVRALRHSLDNNRLHHAYLFTGTRGVGKTTLSRLLAKSFSCEQGVSSNPCQVCSNCLSIMQNKYIDYIEIDAASNRGVEEISKILENTSYQPSIGRFKIFMIDEVHMLSNHAFNAMLKILEEPPAHIKFILATTEVHKIPLTILSRCLQFNLNTINNDSIYNAIINILNLEKIHFEEKAVKYLAKSAKGSMRDSLSMTDQAIALGEGKVIEQDVKDMLGLVDDMLPINILSNIINKNTQAVLELANQIQNPNNFLDSLINILQHIAILQFVPDAELDIFLANNLKQMSIDINKEKAQIYYQMCLKSKEELNYCTFNIVLNMLFLKMIHFNIYDNANIAAKQSISINNQLISHIKQDKILKVNENKGHIEDISKLKIQNIQEQKPKLNESNESLDINNNQDIIHFTNTNWLNLVPNLGIEGLTLEIAKQSVWVKFDSQSNNIYLSCALDTNMMKSAVNRLEYALCQYFNMPISLNFKAVEVHDLKQQNMKNLRIQEQEQEQEQKNIQQKNIDTDEWIQEFVNIGAKISIDGV